MRISNFLRIVAVSCAFFSLTMLAAPAQAEEASAPPGVVGDLIRACASHLQQSLEDMRHISRLAGQQVTEGKIREDLVRDIPAIAKANSSGLKPEVERLQRMVDKGAGSFAPFYLCLMQRRLQQLESESRRLPGRSGSRAEG